MKLSVVIPCYNEGGSVIPLYEECLQVFGERGIDFELVYVNDGSSDDTLERLREVCARGDGAVRVVDFSRNFGKDAAIYAGLRESHGDYTAIMDGDMQQPPSVVADMLEFLESHPDFDCVGAVQEHRREGCVLSFFKRCFYRLINAVSSVDFVNGASDFRLFTASMRKAILSMSEYYRFSKGIFSYVGFRTHFMEYHARARNAGKTKFSFFKLIRYAIDGIIGFSIQPLRIMTFVGSLLSVFSFLYLVFVVIQKLVWGINIPGYPTLVVLILLTGGIQMLGLGILGEYLGRNYVETKRRPIYIARRIYDSRDKAD